MYVCTMCLQMQPDLIFMYFLLPIVLSISTFALGRKAPTPIRKVSGASVSNIKDGKKEQMKK